MTKEETKKVEDGKEKNVGYILAVQLRDNEYPQNVGEGEILDGEFGLAYAPTKQEIKKELWNTKGDDEYIKYNVDEESNHLVTFMQHIGKGKTQEEALVNLYIMLK